MTCGSCAEYRAHKAIKGVGACRVMPVRRERPVIIAGDSPCYFAVSRWTEKAAPVDARSPT